MWVLPIPSVPVKYAINCDLRSIYVKECINNMKKDLNNIINNNNSAISPKNNDNTNNASNTNINTINNNIEQLQMEIIEISLLLINGAPKNQIFERCDILENKLKFFKKINNLNVLGLFRVAEAYHTLAIVYYYNKHPKKIGYEYIMFFKLSVTFQSTTL